MKPSATVHVSGYVDGTTELVSVVKFISNHQMKLKQNSVLQQV